MTMSSEVVASRSRIRALMGEDEVMALDRTDRGLQDPDADLFSQGWFDRHIDSVMARIVDRPDALRPQLIGPRAEAMRGFYPEPAGR